MSNIRRTAMGSAVDIDMLRLANENTIAIGNAKTNARGDLLGAGGKVVKTRAQVMNEYHKINTQLANDDDVIYEHPGQANEAVVDSFVTPALPNVLQPVAEDTPIAENESIPSYTKPRGSFADSIAKETEVTQELVTPPAATKGIQRI
jgi:hypothetical protein